MRNYFIGLLTLAFMGCSYVQPGHVGVKVYLLGGDKGVSQEVLGVGRYWIGMNEQLYVFPTFQQNYVWTRDKTEGNTTDESLTFQTKEGMTVNADVGISYSINPDKVGILFQKYRRGIEEITDTFLRNQVRDAINDSASQLTVEEVYSVKKSAMIATVQETVQTQVKEQGIIIDKVYLIGSIRLPETVEKALNSKLEANQRAQQRENEVAEARAQAAKEVAAAEGAAKVTFTKAEAESKAALVRARAEAEANRLKLQTLTKELIQYETVQKWNGALPTFSGGGAMPLITLPSDTK